MVFDNFDRFHYLQFADGEGTTLSRQVYAFWLIGTLVVAASEIETLGVLFSKAVCLEDRLAPA